MKNPKKIFQVIGSLALIASIAMFIVGSNSGHLTELKDFFWAPLILAVVCFFAATKK
ncbi:MAG: hypothetical protein AAB383_03315 [Patescibacteria group bacterium]